MSGLVSIARNLSKFGVVIEKSYPLVAVAPFHFDSKLNLPQVPLSRTQTLIKPDCIISRSYAKSKSSKIKGSPKFPIDDHELSVVFEVDKLYSQFRRPVDNLKKLFVERVTTRSAGAIEVLPVNYEGQTYAVQDLAEIGRKGQKEVILDMGAFAHAIPSVLDAIRKSALGLNPTRDGNTIYVPVPKVTKEHREKLVREAKNLFNNCKRNIREVEVKYIRKLETLEKLPKDDSHRLRVQLTALGNKHIAEAEEILKTKEKELLSTE